MRRLVVVAGLIGLAALGYYLFLAGPQEVCTACLSYRGRASCATASGGTAAAAVERARQKACADLAGDSAAACLGLPPASVQCETR
jgi:hypothetical protein